MKSDAQLNESIERFRQVFWSRLNEDRPPVAVFPAGVFLPIKYLRRPFGHPEVCPSQVASPAVMTDYEFASINKQVPCDDWIPFVAAWRAVPWVEAICGCPVQYATGSLAARACVPSSSQFRDEPVIVRSTWLDALRTQTEHLVATAPHDCWVSPTIVRGPSDVLAAMRGLTHFYCDLLDYPQRIAATARRINQLLIDVLNMHFSLVAPKRGGYGHIYGYWAPDKTIAIQEDVLGMCAPRIYRELFQQYNAELVEHLGECVLYHLHSTGFQHYCDVLEISGLAGLQLTVEANGPSLLDIVPHARRVLERTRLILFVDHFFDELPEALGQLPREGLYVMVSDRFVRSEAEFVNLLKQCWR